MAKADEKGAGGFPHRMERGFLLRCARFRLEGSEVGNLLYRFCGLPGLGSYLTYSSLESLPLNRCLKYL